ncbi:MAG: hypothetical protein HQL27_04530 [Candidatus Omnitrophica bacterium]|nr:hypothetical protein [Candidatus Omnitrophota bacterium]
MIVKMKKVYLIVQNKDAFSSLEALRELGVIHVEHEKEPISLDTQKLGKDIQLLTDSTAILEEYQKEDFVRYDGDWEKAAKEIISLSQRKSHLNEQISKRSVKIDFWKAWGNFHPKDIISLREKGVYVYLAEISKKEIKNIPAGSKVEVLGQKGNMLRVLTVANKEITLPFTALTLPEVGLEELAAEQARDKEEVSRVTNKLTGLIAAKDLLEKELAQKKSQLKFQEALAGMGNETGLSYLKGFCPLPLIEGLKKQANTSKWGLLLEDPSADDFVPTLLENPKWIKLVNPIFEFMGIVPGYREADVSLCFLFFFSAFFGILIGDAGYGLIFFFSFFFLHQKMKGKVKDFTWIYLLYVLSSSAIIWGIFTGTFFGTVLFGKYVKPVIPWLSDERKLQFLCFLIGAIHLTIAHAWKAIRKGKTWLVLSDAGWIVIVWSAFFYAQQFILSVPVPSWVNPAVIISFFVIIAFSQTLEDIKKDAASLVVNSLLTVLSVISTLIDVISYIRLFAVGIAGVSLADSFSQMALGIGFKSFLFGILAIVILAAGHMLTLVLGILAVMVHGLRLNILEFSGHLGLEWSGRPYEPLRKSI